MRNTRIYTPEQRVDLQIAVEVWWNGRIDDQPDERRGRRICESFYRRMWAGLLKSEIIHWLGEVQAIIEKWANTN